MMEVVDRVGVRMRRSFAVQMRMLWREFRMFVQNNVGTARRPERAREQDAAERDPGKDKQGRHDSDRRAEPAGQGVSQQPTRVRERELRGKYRRTVRCAGRPPQQAAGRGHHRRVGDAQ